MSKHLSVFAMLAPFALADIYPVALPSWDLNGPQSGVGSWYRASAGQDSTNGKSWCAYEYYNSDPIFAPSLKHMGGATYKSNPTAWTQQTRKFCGLEAKVTDPSTGKTSLLYIGDSFDDQYVKTQGYIDIMIDSFSSLYRNPGKDKNIVIKNVQWELTGRVNTKYTASGASWPSVSSTASTAKPTTMKTSTSSQSPSQTSGTCTGCLGTQCDGKTIVCYDGLTCLAPDGVCSNAACNWGCKGWSCDASTPCQKPSSCVNGVCTAAGTCAGCVDSPCDGKTNVCNTGLTCLSPDGICKDAACNWGCVGWSCGASSPCQAPSKCASGSCVAANA